MEVQMPKNFLFSGSGDPDNTSYGFIEISIDPSLLSGFSNEDSIGAYLNSHDITDEIQALKGELLEEVMHIINNCLTEKQEEVIKMTYLDGKTQNEISIELGKHQTTIHKILQGNIDYNNQKKRYGGALKKIRKLCLNNEKIQEILVQIRKKCTNELET